MHKPVTKTVLADIVSSQLDSDRLDYLLRDSHFCGVKYGEFDFRWMLHCMTIVQSDEGERLGITHKGIGVVEHYLMARRLMTRNIYHSQKKLALEMLLVQLLANLAERLEEEQAYEDIRQSRLGKFLLAVNKFNHAVENGDDIQPLKQAFLEKNYSIYKDFCDYDVFSIIRQLTELNDGSPCCEIANRLQHRIMPKILRLDNAKLKTVENEINEFKLKNHKHIQDWQLCLIQTPHRSYSGQEDPILVVNEHGVMQPVSESSFMINAISDRLEHIAFLAIDDKIAQDKQVLSLKKHLQKTVVHS